eukprot:7655755-Alexandrium_andersonii.AAC.1
MRVLRPRREGLRRSWAAVAVARGWRGDHARGPAWAGLAAAGARQGRQGPRKGPRQGQLALRQP